MGSDSISLPSTAGWKRLDLGCCSSRALRASPGPGVSHLLMNAHHIAIEAASPCGIFDEKRILLLHRLLIRAEDTMSLEIDRSFLRERKIAGDIYYARNSDIFMRFILFILLGFYSRTFISRVIYIVSYIYILLYYYGVILTTYDALFS